MPTLDCLCGDVHTIRELIVFQRSQISPNASNWNFLSHSHKGDECLYLVSNFQKYLLFLASSSSTQILIVP